MFPSYDLVLSQLDPNAHYCIGLEFNLVSRCRYKYSTAGGWVPAGTEEAQSVQRFYLHPDSPATGDYWMRQPISFHKVKLTNNPSPPSGQIVLSSMHKYQPTIIISKTSDPRTMRWSPINSFTFPQTQFVAVTAYQNEAITQLKIDNNPFAKGFRENGHSKTKKRKQQQPDQEPKDPESPKDKKLPREETSSPEIVDEGRLSHSSRESSPELSSSPIEATFYPPAIQPFHSNLYHPMYSQAFYHHSPYYYPYSLNVYSHLEPGYVRDLRLNSKYEENTRKLTDFSIRAILDSA